METHSVMRRRPVVLAVTSHLLGQLAYPLGQFTTQFFKFLDPRLLGAHRVIQLGDGIVLERKARFQFGDAVFVQGDYSRKIRQWRKDQ